MIHTSFYLFALMCSLSLWSKPVEHLSQFYFSWGSSSSNTKLEDDKVGLSPLHWSGTEHCVQCVQ